MELEQTPLPANSIDYEISWKIGAKALLPYESKHVGIVGCMGRGRQLTGSRSMKKCQCWDNQRLHGPICADPDFSSVYERIVLQAAQRDAPTPLTLGTWTEW